jgi:hypothetical protein
VKGLLVTLAVLTCGRCAHRPGEQAPVAQAPAVTTSIFYFGQAGIGLGCLPRAGDSTRFEVDVVVDSLRNKNGAALSLIRRERSVPRAGYIYQAVTVEVQRANQTRFFGTSCWHDAGIVVRGPEASLADARVFLDAQGAILARVFDGHGRVLSDSAHIGKQSRGARISWPSLPRDGR